MNTYPGMTAQYWHSGTLFATNGGFVFSKADGSRGFRKVTRIPRKHPQKNPLRDFARYYCFSSRLVRRLRKTVGPNMRVCSDGTLLMNRSGIYRGKDILQPIEYGAIDHCMHQGWCEDSRGYIYFGDYKTGWKKTGHEIIRLHRSTDCGRSWEIAVEFDRGRVRHIHSVQYDPYHDLLWVTTGDSDSESLILYSSDAGESFQKLGGGSQQWRTCSLQFTEDAIYWGTDSPQISNHLYRWKWSEGIRELLLTTRNPIYYSCQDGTGNIFFSTACERPEIDGTEPFVRIFKVKDGDTPIVEEVVTYAIDARRDRYRTIQFAQGSAPLGLVAFTPVGVVKDHGNLIVMATNEE